MFLRRLIPFFDPSVPTWSAEARWLRWLTLIWVFVGLVMLFSASYSSGYMEHGDGLYYFKRQLIWVSIGLIGFSVFVHLPLKYVLHWAKWGIFLLLGLLFIILIPGLGTSGTYGTTRWLSIGAFPLQPSELIKPWLILQSARVFAKWQQLTSQLQLFWLGIFGAVLIGILLQPNLSTTALCGITLWMIALAAGLPWKQLGGTAIIGIFLGGLSLTINGYQRRRILSFINPWGDPMGDGYQLIQSLLAIGSGRISGTGLGLSQQKLFYLPIQYSDFIFAVYAEEFGLIGGLVLLIFLVAYATLALRVALKARQVEHQLIAIGTMVILIGQSLLNIGVATGTLPTTGLPLPLFSYGGSSMIASLAVAGLLVRVARESSKAEIISFPVK